MQGTSMQIKQRPGAAGLRAKQSRAPRLNVAAKQYSGPPPAWPKRVVVPEVQPRDGPKVRRAADVRTCAAPPGAVLQRCPSVHGPMAPS